MTLEPPSTIKASTLSGVIPWNAIPSRRHPLLYMKCPKSACTTILNLIYQLDHDGRRHPDPVKIHEDANALLSHIHPDQAAREDAVYRRCFTFTFVREPYARAYSAFNDKFFRPNLRFFAAWRQTVIETYGARFPDDGQSYTADQHAANFVSYLKFVHSTLDSSSGVKPDAHWIPQVDILNAHRRHLNLDFVGKVENFVADMRRVFEAARIDAPLDLSARHNEAVVTPFPFRDILNDDVAKWLKRIYGKDVVYFAYHALSDTLVSQH